MECHDAQEAISAALDGATPDSAALDAAKRHCRDCAECGAFVRALTLVKRAPLPDPPAGLPDKVMAAVRREAAAEQERTEAAAAMALAASVAAAAGGGGGGADAASGDAAGTAPADVTNGISSVSPGRRKPTPAVLAAWVGVAAVLAVSVGVAAIGVRMMSANQAGTGTSQTMRATTSPSDAGSVDVAAPPAAEAATDSAGAGVVVSAGPKYVVYSGLAYRLVGPSTLDKSQLAVLGTTKTALDGGALRARDVFGAAGVPGIYVQDDAGELLEFQPLERKFENRTYQLRSAEIAEFGSWPLLPTDIPVPSSVNGSPTFTAAGADPSGVTIYRKTASSVAEGIAVAPGAAAQDPATGNPNWTWWTPAP